MVQEVIDQKGNNKKELSPLVSIIVVTYNSSEYILETLESAKSQLYKNIELIVTDDCSKDNTINICKDWIKRNSGQFVNTKVIEAESNSGVPANCNRGVSHSRGKWIKLIAGDDLLMENCISDCMNFVSEKNICVLAGRLQPFSISETGNMINHLNYPYDLEFFKLSAENQNKYLLKKSFNFAPAVFFRRSIIIELGGFDERFKYFEDLPMWLKLTSLSYKIYYLDKKIVYYRINHNSLVNRHSEFFNPLFMECMLNFKKKEVYPKIEKTDFLFFQSEAVFWMTYYIITVIFQNRKNSTTKMINKMSFYFIFDSYVQKLKRLLN